MLRKIIGRIFVISIFTIFIGFFEVNAQLLNPCDAIPPECAAACASCPSASCEQCLSGQNAIPVDGGILYLLFAGGIYSLKRIRDHRNKKY